VARERVVDGLLDELALRRSLLALRRVALDPDFGGGNFTPDRRAFDNPMAIACFVDRAPCFPSRTCSISSRTNSPAWVLGAFPSALSCLARSSVSFSGITPPRGVSVQKSFTK
jgi:hypothetical protein